MHGTNPMKLSNGTRAQNDLFNNNALISACAMTFQINYDLQEFI
jgi:hypothetical protein